MDDEVTEWRPVPGYEQTYAVSSDGQITSVRRRGARGGLLTQHIGDDGYPIVELWRNNQGVKWRVHRVVALAFIGPCPPGQEVLHGDGMRDNPHLSNLSYGTRSENMLDAVRHGTHPTASRTHCPHGHPYDEVNTRWYQGRRYCRTCGNRRTRPVRMARA